jgi:exodeoxyribonuclease VII small subunit
MIVDVRGVRMSDPLPDNLTFEQALAELECVVRDLEDGQTGLEGALARYEAGVRLLKGCYQQLRAAEQRILLLTGEDADGKPVLQAFEHAATAESDKSEALRRRNKVEERENLF